MNDPVHDFLKACLSQVESGNEAHLRDLSNNMSGKNGQLALLSEAGTLTVGLLGAEGPIFDAYGKTWRIPTFIYVRGGRSAYGSVGPSSYPGSYVTRFGDEAVARWFEEHPELGGILGLVPIVKLLGRPLLNVLRLAPAVIVRRLEISADIERLSKGLDERIAEWLATDERDLPNTKYLHGHCRDIVRVIKSRLEQAKEVELDRTYAEGLAGRFAK